VLQRCYAKEVGVMFTITAPRALWLGRPFSFLRHLVVMTLAMLLGMVAYGLVVGSSFEGARLDQPELFALGMATSMSVPMVAWMHHRGHGRRDMVEMTAAMFVPALFFIGCFELHAVSAASICPLACAAMIPAMVVAMLFRRDDYTGHHAVG